MADDKKNIDIKVVDGDYVGGLVNSNTNRDELKVLFEFMDRIDCEEISAKTVVFEHGEVEDFFGEKVISKEKMKNKTHRLGKIISLLRSDNRDMFSVIQVFKKIEFEMGDDDFWKLTLVCTEAAVRSIFKADEISYLKFKLKNLLELSNKYSSFMYLKLENVRKESIHNGEPSVKVKFTLDELRESLKCTSSSYNEFKIFNQNILKQCCNEINSKTFLHYDYEPVDKDKKRFYTAVEFTIYDADVDYGYVNEDVNNSKNVNSTL